MSLRCYRLHFLRVQLLIIHGKMDSTMADVRDKYGDIDGTLEYADGALTFHGFD